MEAASSTPDTAVNVCHPCRGTGRVISSLGGTAHEVSCPWCEGTGVFVAGRDAQESPAESGKSG